MDGFVFVPVTLDGVQIGTARVSENGRIDLSISTNHRLGAELYWHVRAELTGGLTLSPQHIPAVDAAKKIRSFAQEETVEIPLTRSWNNFRTSGLLWLVNRVVFHPRGRALALVFNEGGEALGWRLLGDGKEVWGFDHDEEKSLFRAAESTLRVVEKREEKEGI